MSLGQCINNGQKFIETDGNGKYLREYNTVNSAWCAGNDNQAGTIDDCCPLGSSCSLNAPVGCIIDNDPVDECSDYLTQQECESYDPDIALADGTNQGLECSDPNDQKNFSCYWNSASDPERCQVRLSCIPNDGTGDCVSYSCDYSYEASECKNGWMEVTYSWTFNTGTCGDVDESVCEIIPNPKQVPCGRLNFELAFFDYKQMMLALLIIGIIYLLYWKVR